MTAPKRKTATPPASKSAADFLTLSVWAPDSGSIRRWRDELSRALGSAQAQWIDELAEARLVFVDGTRGDAAVEKWLRGFDRRGKALVLISEDGEQVPRLLEEGAVDDVIVHPFRAVEVMGKLTNIRQLLRWEEVEQLNVSFTGVLESLRGDLQIVENLQKAKTPARFPAVRGFRVQSRYLAGMRSGGDHFDLGESKEGSQLSLVLTDSSSYGLSSAVLSALMRVAVKLDAPELRSSHETVRRIHEDLLLTLKEKDRLSIFYGVISRKDYRLRYLNLGGSCAFHSPVGERGPEAFRVLPSQGEPLSRGLVFPSGVLEGEVELTPEDRLAVVSDGFVEAVGGPEAMCRLLDQFRARDAKDVLNELVFRVKARFTDDDDMPEQDCTAVVMDVDSRLIRLAGK